jgi:hypothetical protein
MAKLKDATELKSLGGDSQTYGTFPVSFSQDMMVVRWVL